MSKWARLTTVPQLKENGCYVWRIKTHAYHPDYEDMLTDEEVQRAQRYHHVIDRKRFVLGTVLTRVILAKELNITPRDIPIIRTCPTCGKPHGQPRLPAESIYWSVSHSGEEVVVAFSRSLRVGVDIEKIQTDIEDLLVSTILTHEEQEHFYRAADKTDVFYTYWTRKEAVLKALGTGFSQSPKSIRFTLAGNRINWSMNESKEDLRKVTGQVSDIPVGAHYKAALALLSGVKQDIYLLDATYLSQITAVKRH
ncbi:4'-phosphopantetheinyl transferase superfamily protein [Salipaludibacillus sp. LMS25]|jgi:4'-phosphopantetheinyl transferase|uniref:4'-phosphopantetheinyl transferase family protein n=1 Tax=Salipaludibacillus sp. LMS25 TaxID=2924031 RepID=UPI0020D1D5FC|nr:4'-phosphopantetheinyl transferase superfamily protein [Salipaludibacillus sp. LMS25]UTR13172.1 4'-phosphopantetheinyl transferase superfamily protein [Salipaludibacillus sp. LMS25]